jgi:hypothetical protein
MAFKGKNMIKGKRKRDKLWKKKVERGKKGKWEVKWLETPFGIRILSCPVPDPAKNRIRIHTYTHSTTCE